ncbi:hypothetical protein B0H34DRAFT_708123 [Crassisporium funariophilum]|nr:hypothetical protein B0H34DRAFT_708123 [Crassisporium funariophilum]
MQRFFISKGLSVQRGYRQRFLATKTQPLPRKMDDSGEDFRPPWVYTTSRLITYAIIPAIAVYSIFLYDFGEGEHVFQPIRRLAADKINIFFTLSPAEEKLLQDNQLHGNAPNGSTNKPLEEV